MNRFRTPWIVIAFIAALALIVIAVATPRPATLSEHTAGDPALATQLRELTPDRGHQSVAAVVITRDGMTHAAIGESAPNTGRPIGPGDTIELGSITKTFNGFLLADAVTRGEVRLDDPVGQHLRALSGTPIGDVTLEELATHHGGVPPLPPSVLLRGLPTNLTGGNPYASATRDSVLTEVAGLEPMNTRGSEAYSNLGATLLGWALADAAGAPDWETHVHARLLEPLGVEPTFAATQADVPNDTVPGFTANGFGAPHWTSPAFRPAGAGTYVAVAEVGAYAQAILDNRAPGLEAMDPRFEGEGSVGVGLGWFVDQPEGAPPITWHNGGTAGYRTMLGIDREAGRAVFVVGNTDRPVDAIAPALLSLEQPGSPDQPEAAQPGLSWVDLVVPGIALFLVASAFVSALRGRSRSELMGSVAGAVFALALARLLGSWVVLGGWVWAVLVLATAVAAGLGVRRWSGLPWHPRRFRVWGWINTGLSVALAVAALVLARR
ncbi:serine hydrolase domain-containing protein [Granulicoccus sp. GXG6511]|uniref:serine hydrolase domain-containing protein n=1 Tax=Granulicoccus sp. GXG6511 TaxID=3381351 RepID=UPI003D7C8B28